MRGGISLDQSIDPCRMGILRVVSCHANNASRIYNVLPLRREITMSSLLGREERHNVLVATDAGGWYGGVPCGPDLPAVRRTLQLAGLAVPRGHHLALPLLSHNRWVSSLCRQPAFQIRVRLLTADPYPGGIFFAKEK